MNILIVDDHSSHRRLLRAQLEAEEFSVIEAADGVEALEALAREPLDAVISDILMPRMDGYRLCHELRKAPGLQGLRFILYSSTYTSPGDIRLSVTVGADRFIAKPASIAVILEALKIPSADRTLRPPVLPDEAMILQQYSAVLVGKLEEKNIELQQALEASHRAHSRIEELNFDLERRVSERTAELVTANDELTAALAELKQLNGLLPICSYCKRIRDDKNYWENVEAYITRHTESKFSHSICPACYDEHVSPMLKKMRAGPPSFANGSAI